MYHALLTNRYLTSRVIPLIAVGAVALCVALVIIVVSVMTGFLNMVKSSGRALMGDVVISYQVSGIPHYERLIDRLGQLAEVSAAAPVVDSLGILQMPYPDGPDKQTEVVQIWGVDERFADVTGYGGTLHYRVLSDRQRRQLTGDLLRTRWKRALELLGEDARVEFIRSVLMMDQPREYEPPADAAIRARLGELNDEQWAEFFDAASGDVDAARRVFAPEQWSALLSLDPRLLRDDEILRQGLKLEANGDRNVIVLGMHVSEGNQRQSDGTYEAALGGYWWMPRFQVTLTTIPVAQGVSGAEQAERRVLRVVNEMVSGVYLIDDRRVMVPISVAQEMLHLDKADRVDDEGTLIGEDPARATMVLVRARDGVSPERLQEVVADEYADFHAEIASDASAVVKPPRGLGLGVLTWEQQQAQFIGPIEKERELMRTIFSVVYIVCAALVLSIFWAIVYEKTRDIGILRSIGAARAGIVWIFLRYGLVVGVIGSIVGLGLAFLVTRNINSIHSALAKPPLTLGVGVVLLGGACGAMTVALSLRGRLLPMVAGSMLTVALLALGGGILLLRSAGGVVVWDPSVYYFTRIPNELDMTTALTTMIGAVIFSLVGAAVPAAKAADTDPVKALRYE